MIPKELSVDALTAQIDQANTARSQGVGLQEKDGNATTMLSDEYDATLLTLVRWMMLQDGRQLIHAWSGYEASDDKARKLWKADTLIGLAFNMGLLPEKSV